MLVNRRNVVAIAGAVATAMAAPTGGSAQLRRPVDIMNAAKLAESGTLDDMIYGNLDAAVTIVEYASLTCSHCAEFALHTFPKIKEKYIDTGKVRLIFREFPFDPRATAAAMLMRCAPEEHYFALLELLCRQQKEWTSAPDGEAALFQLAKVAGFTHETFRACLADQQALNAIRATVERALNDFGVTATPTFFINGHKYPGALTFGEMSSIIDNFLLSFFPNDKYLFK